MSKDNITQEQIDQLLGYINSAVDFTKEQLPDVVSEILNYGLISAWTGALSFGVIFIITGIIAITYRDDMPFFSTLAVIISIIGLMCNVDTIIKINHAPKLYVVSQLTGLIK